MLIEKKLSSEFEVERRSKIRIIEDLEKQFKSSIEIDDSKLILAMFALYHLKKSGVDQVTVLDDITNALPDKHAVEIARIFTSCISFFNPIIKRYSMEEIRQAILDYEFSKRKENGFINTPQSIADLMLSIVNINKDSDVADYCCGYGQIIMRALKQGFPAKYYGVENEPMLALAAYARLYMMDNDIEIDNRDVFANDEVNRKFDVIFCNPPFNAIFAENTDGYNVMREISDLAGTKARRTVSNWAFVYQIIKNLKDTGKAVCILPAGAAFNTFDRDLRKYFVDQGYVESVIMLPGNLFTYTSISVMLLVLSHHNKKVRLLDYTDEKSDLRRGNYLTEQTINLISATVKDAKDTNVDVPNEQIAKTKYDLNPMKYICWQESKEGVPLGEISNIKRGITLTADEIEKRVTKKKTSNRFIRIADIQNGVLSNDPEHFQYLDECKENEQYSVVSKRSVIISKIAQPLKIAVVEPPAGEQFILGGSIYALEPKEDSWDPYFLKAYLESEEGKKALLLAQSGRTIPAIAIAQLKEIIIPYLSLGTVRKISEEYEETEKKIIDLEDKLAELRKHRDEIYEKVIKEGKDVR